MPKIHVDIDLTPMQIFGRRIATLTGALRDMTYKWAARYRGFARARFIRYSRGGGDWPYLAPSTLAARRRKTPGGRMYVIDRKTGKRRRTRGKTNASSKLSQRPRILWDTGLLIGALQPRVVGAPGQLQKDEPHGILVGYGGPHRYPKGKQPTIADIAHFHQTGAGRVPQRKIIVKPDALTRQGMTRDLEVALKREGT